MAAPNISFRFTREPLSLKPTRCRPQAGSLGSKSRTRSRLRCRATPRNSSVPSAGYSKGLVHAPPGSGPVSLRLDRRTATLVTPHTYTGGAAAAGRPIDNIEVRACWCIGASRFAVAVAYGFQSLALFPAPLVHSPSCWPQLDAGLARPVRFQSWERPTGSKPEVHFFISRTKKSDDASIVRARRNV
jgi:hypothetical protein